MLLVPEFTLQLQVSGVYRGLGHFPRIGHGIGIKHFPAHWILTTSYHLCLGIIEAVKFYEAGLDPEALSVGFQIHTFQPPCCTAESAPSSGYGGSKELCSGVNFNGSEAHAVLGDGLLWCPLVAANLVCGVKARTSNELSPSSPAGKYGRFLKYHNSHLIRQENPFLPLSEQFQ